MQPLLNHLQHLNILDADTSVINDESPLDVNCTQIALYNWYHKAPRQNVRCLAYVYRYQ